MRYHIYALMGEDGPMCVITSVVEWLLQSSLCRRLLPRWTTSSALYRLSRLTTVRSLYPFCQPAKYIQTPHT